jgi:hypothetical protein
MKYKIVLCLVISALSLVSCQSAQSQKAVSQQATPQKTPPQKAEWQPASVEGIQIGKTNIKDVGNVFGHKLNQTFFKDGNGAEVWHEYEVKLFNKWDGKLTFVTEKGVITSAVFTPRNMSKSEAMDFFGNDFVVSHYRIESSEDDDIDSGTVIEDENGDIETIEYRNKGIAVFPDSKNMITDIQFLSQPLWKKSIKSKESSQEK